MPRETFYNLPPDKRQRFIDAALDTFARDPYDQASITGLMRRLGLAKGSFYQYFQDKLDLFSWLLSLAASHKLEGVHTATASGEDVFDGLARAYAAGLQLWREEPRLAAVALQLQRPSKEPRLQALRQEQERRSTAWLRARLAEGQAQGVVRQDLDLDVAAALLHATLSQGLLHALLCRADTSLDQVLDAPEPLTTLGDQDVQAVIDQALAFVRGAVGNPPTRL